MDSVENFLTATEEKKVVQAIHEAEKNTSGEIRVHIEKSSKGNALQRAQEVFNQLGMFKTKQRNGVLFYVATDTHQFAILGDEGIDKQVPKDFWQKETSLVINNFRKNKNCEGLCEGITLVGEKLKAFFPYQTDDVDELTNEISKG
jgi:uncharacterized membrane protein